ncbi:MAG: rRNA maturation RNase YbeY [candidate division Zixibacteria bacterium]|nr:rRNA maturation RNase YbeY [candidate division Zixibacteria bacterium]
MKLRIFKEIPARLPVARINRLFDEISTSETDRLTRGTVNLVITDDKNIRRLNRDYRRKDRATDVLSFNLDDPDDDDGVFGEIYISAETARRQTTEYETVLNEEYLRLFCHGLLHLFGFDHMKKNDERIMKAREERYLKAVGR